MLPRTVKIGAHNYRIKSVPASELEEYYGDIDRETMVIRVAKGISISRRIEVILHECVHGMLYTNDMDDEEEEKVADFLGETLALFLADNPFFVIEAVKRLADRKNFLAAVDKAVGKS